VITPRRVTLHRVADLPAFRTLLSEWLIALPPQRARDTCVVVPTRASAEQLRRTIEERALGEKRSAIVWPIFTTRRDLYDELASRLHTPPPALSPFEREVLVAAIGRSTIDRGIDLPYELRPGLVAEMVAFYDHIRRLGRSIADFERNFLLELEPEQHTDRGARRLLQQTAFLAASYRTYEDRVGEMDRCDEHGVRDRLIGTPSQRPLRRAIITIGDRIVEPEGLWPADYDLLARLPGLEDVDLVCTEGVLGAGYLERLFGAFPHLTEARPPAAPRRVPTLVAPNETNGASSSICLSSRDREEELIAVARRLKQHRCDGRTSSLHRAALVVQRPLPYLYLARDVFRDAGIPFETLDTLPLAAEPYAAAVDLVLDAIAADFSRSALLSLLRSPHFTFAIDTSVDAAENHSELSIRALASALAEARYLGGLERLRFLATSWAKEEAAATREERRRRVALPALRAIADAMALLAPLAERRPLVQQIDRLVDWLQRFEPPAPRDGDRSRRLRVRGAVWTALWSLRNAYATHDPDAQGDVGTLTAALRRWLEAQTFATTSGTSGIHLIDARAARYGSFDDIQILGLVDGEWPERTRRNVLYPSSLLALLEPAPGVPDANACERDALRSARALFRDLVGSASEHVRLSSFLLENDAVVEPSLLLDEVPAMGLPVLREIQPSLRVTYSEALALERCRLDVMPHPVAPWAEMRLARDMRDRQTLRGEAGAWTMPRISVSRLETFLNCPFKFFAAHVLRLEEEPEDQPIQTPLERGRFLHDLWERFFAAWQERGHGRIDPDRLSEARALFGEVCEEALAALSPVEAALERHRLLGSAIGAGIAHRVLGMEAGRRDRVEERLLEFPLEGQFEFRTRDGDVRVVPINAKTDRIDVLEGRRLRVIDYKSKSTPDPKVALQLPIYAHLAREVLQKRRGGYWSLEEAMYLSFEGDRAVVPLKPAKGDTLEAFVAEAQHRLIDALDRITAGHFPPQPAKKSMCGPCGYRGICRLDYVGVEGVEGTEGVEGGSEGHEGSEGRGVGGK
jgi:RecB family exonuclease